MTPRLALVIAEGHPIIDLDATVLVQLLIFVVTAYVLTQFLFKPFLAVRAAREAGIEGARDEARRFEEEAGARISDYEGKIGRARQGANEERRKLRQDATTREREIQDAAVKRSQSAIGDARARLETDAAAARQALAPKSTEIARVIAKKILGREVA